MERIAYQGTLSGIDTVPDDIKALWVCSHDVSYEWHVKMQAAFQEFTDNAVSKTINFPASASKADIRNSYMSAWELGLKGITVYRDASRRSQVLNISRSDPTRDTPSLDREDESALENFSAQPACQVELSRASCDLAAENGDEKIKKSRSTSAAGTVISPQTDGTSLGILDVYPGNDRNLFAGDITSASSMRSGFHDSLDLEQARKCPECGYGPASLARREACLLCLSCGYTKC
jgi:ribonucleotide reductase alpha subunit